MRTRGRWLNHKVMQIYIQELTAMTYLSRVPQSAKDRICIFAAAVPHVLWRAVSWQLAGVAPSFWPQRFREAALFEA